MKWLRPTFDAAGTPDAVFRRLLADVADATGQPVPLKDVQVEAVGVVLRGYLEAHGEVSVSAGRVAELGARTLADLGDCETARRLLLLGCGVVRPDMWEISGGETLWVLDLRRLAVGSGVQTELSVFRSLDATTTAMADVWDASSGQGRLGLRHAQGTAERLLGNADGRRKRARALANELRLRCEARLRDLAAHRRWEHVPEVLSLD